MQRKKIIQVIFILLVAIALYFYLSEKKENSDDLTHKFSIQDTSEVSRIIITYGDSKVDLEKVKNNWILNQNYMARRIAVQTLLGALKRIQVTSFINEFSMPEVKQNLLNNKLAVWVYKKDEPVLHFFIYENVEKQSGTFMMMSEETTAYKVNIPGFNGNIISLFRYDFAFWRNNTVFSISPQKISSIRVTYKEKPKNSYSLVLDESGKFILEVDGNKFPEKETDANKIKQYLSYFQDITSEEYVSLQNISQNDTSGLVGSLSITNLNGKKSTFNLFLKQDDSTGQKFDLNRAYVKDVSTGEVAQVNYVVLDLIFKDAGYFIIK